MSLKVLVTRCHGRGREFESRRPRHNFQSLTSPGLNGSATNDDLDGLHRRLRIFPGDGARKEGAICPIRNTKGHDHNHRNCRRDDHARNQYSSSRIWCEFLFEKLPQPHRLPGRPGIVWAMVAIFNVRERSQRLIRRLETIQKRDSRRAHAPGIVCTRAATTPGQLSFRLIGAYAAMSTLA